MNWVLIASVLKSTYVAFNSCALTIFDTALNSGIILTLHCKNHKKIVYLVARKKRERANGHSKEMGRMEGRQQLWETHSVDQRDRNSGVIRCVGFCPVCLPGAQLMFYSILSVLSQKMFKEDLSA